MLRIFWQYTFYQIYFISFNRHLFKLKKKKLSILNLILQITEVVNMQVNEGFLVTDVTDF